MGETSGNGHITAKNYTNNTIVTYNISIYDLATPATQAQVAQLIADIKTSAAANNLGVEIERVNSTLV